MVEHRLVETEADDAASMEKALASIEPNGFEVVGDRHGERRRPREGDRARDELGRAHRRAGRAARLAGLRRAAQELRTASGDDGDAAVHDLARQEARRTADTYEDLRHRAIDIAKEGIQVSRFKGLGEMDAEELAATTMDPTKRLLVRVDIEDAATADLIFSTLMGDQVEPRRLFIEQNAKDVKFLDV